MDTLFLIIVIAVVLVMYLRERAKRRAEKAAATRKAAAAAEAAERKRQEEEAAIKRLRIVKVNGGFYVQYFHDGTWKAVDNHANKFVEWDVAVQFQSMYKHLYEAGARETLEEFINFHLQEPETICNVVI